MSRTTVSVNPQRSPGGGHPTPEQRQSDDGTPSSWSKIPHAMIGSVSPTALAVAAALASWADNRTGECFPALDKVAALVEKHRNTVRKAVKDLEAAGWLEVHHRRRIDNAGAGAPGPPSTTNLYRLLWIAPGGCTAKSPPSEGGVHSGRAGGVHSGRATELEPVELKPPLPPLDSQEEPSEALGVEVASAESAEVLDLEQAQAEKYRAQVLDELADLEAARDEAAGTVIRSPGAYVRAIRSRLAADERLSADLDAYRAQYPADTPPELAARYDADRTGSGGARPDRRPVPNADEQDAAGWAKKVGEKSRYAAELAALDLAGGGAQ